VALADLDRVPKSADVFYLQRFYAGAFAFALFELRELRASIGAQAQAFGQFGIRARLNDAAIIELGRRVQSERCVQIRQHLLEVAHPFRIRAQRGRRHLPQRPQVLQRPAKRRQVAGQRAFEAHFLRYALEIETPTQEFLHRLAAHVFVDERRYGILTRRNRRGVNQWRENPTREQPRTHRRGALVQRGQQRRFRIRAQRLDQLQVFARIGIERQERTLPVKLRRPQRAFFLSRACRRADA